MSPPQTAGRITKAKRGKKSPGQMHNKNHRWQSFSSKIAQLHSLDAVHKVRRHDLDAAAESDLSATTSYLRNGIEKWTDLNLSRIFTAFRRKVTPLCDSLAQILHFEDRIMDEMSAAIQEAQTEDDGREALEPLLDLLTAFAHDLGSRFVANGYDARAFALLVDVARHNSGAGIARSHHQQNHVLDAAVIEWTFACLAFLFKYLSRLLVPDLRPTFDILAPLLGRPVIEEEADTEAEAEADDDEAPEETTSRDTDADAADTADAAEPAEAPKSDPTPSPSKPKSPTHRVPGHIARFTAEALSFLVRMTANASRRDSSLPLIINHIRDDLLRAASVPATKKGNTVQLYTQGIMTLFAEANKGPSETLRLSASELFLGLVNAIPDNELSREGEGKSTVWSDVCCGVLTSLVHHTGYEALKPLTDAILADAEPAIKRVTAAVKAKKTPTAATGPWRLHIHVRFLAILSGVRGGYKIKDWSAIVPMLSQLLEAMTSAPESSWPVAVAPTKKDEKADEDVFAAEADTSSPIWQQVIVNTAVVWNHAPLSEIRAQMASITKSLERDPLSRWFVPFCAYAAELNSPKFQATLQGPFQTFINAHWSHDGNEDILCAVVPDMVESGAFSNRGSGHDRLRLPQSWQDSIVRKFEQLEATPFPERGVYGKDPTTWRDHCLPKYAALLSVLDTTVVHPSTPARISELLLRKLKLALRPTSLQLANNDETTFIVTQGFRAYLRMTKALAGKPDAGLRPLLRAAASRFARRTGFLEALLQYEQLVPEEFVDKETKEPAEKKTDEAAESASSDEEDPFIMALVENLSAPDHQLRLVSLQILQHLGDSASTNKKGDKGTTDLDSFADHASALSIMIQTEDIGFAPHNVRNIAAHLRKLAQVYAHVTAGAWLASAIPAFLFGMLSVPLAPVWDDAIKAMKQIAETNKAGEEFIAELAFDWIEVASTTGSASRQAAFDSSKPGRGGKALPPRRRLPPTDFECFRLDKLYDMSKLTQTTAIDPSTAMLETFQVKQEAVPAYAGYERGKALKVLAAMPSMAEKRSRKLVPHLLSWTEDRGPRVEEIVDDDDDDDDEEVEDAEEEEEEEEDDEEEEEADEDAEKAEGDENMEDAEAAEAVEEADEEVEADDYELGGWSFPDKKALIVVFSLFTNSQVLYQSEKAYDALLKLLSNGDMDIQRLALKAIFAWRQPIVAKYKEQLQNLLDESKFKNELTLLMQSDDNESSNSQGIQPAHKAELMPVLLRLLYGRSIAKKGAASGRQGLQATRLFVIRNLDVDGIGGFINVALGNLQSVRIADANGRIHESLFPAASSSFGDDEALLPARKQVGVLNMLDPIINELGTNVSPYLDVLLNTTLYCLICACRGLHGVNEETIDKAITDGENKEELAHGAIAKIAGASLMRKAKTAALRCLCSLFRNAPANFDWTPYRSAIVGEVISPVIERLPQETTQGVSWTWKLLQTWTQLPQCVMFLAADDRILPKIIESLATKAKDVVKIFALGLVNQLVQMSQPAITPGEGMDVDSAKPVPGVIAVPDEIKEQILSQLLYPNMDYALLRLGAVLRSTADGDNKGGSEISRHLLEVCVDTVVALAPLVKATTHVRSLVDIATWLLNQPSRRVNPRVKGGLLLLLERFIRLDSDSNKSTDRVVDKVLQDKVYNTIASLFSFFKDRDNRQTLCRVLAVFADIQEDETTAQQLRVVSDFCFDLNAYGQGVLDDVDYERRLAAFGRIARPAASTPALTAQQWLPLLHNILFYIRVDDEYGMLSTNAADALCKLIEVTSDQTTHQPISGDDKDSKGLVNYLKTLVLPAMYAGARDQSEIVRREISRVFCFMIGALRAWPPVADLSPVVPQTKEDREAEKEEADINMDDTEIDEDDRDVNRAFFANIFAGTTERQIQAMQVLEGINARTPLGSKNVSQFFIPLLEHFIFGREDGVDDRGLGAQATNTIAMLTYSLEWNQYRAVLRRFISFIESKPELQKQIVRLLDKVVDAVAAAGESLVDSDSEKTDAEKEADKAKPKTRLAATLPEPTKLSEEILGGLTPPLFEHLHDKDEETVSARVPAAIILVKLLNLLPPATRDPKLAGVLTDVCHILRSKSWDAREMARDTLSRISTILGPSCFGFVLKELRGALTRGYQLHVLSYTMHTLLMAVIPLFAQGDLDYCVEPIMAVIMDDVFGAVGEEKDAEGYITQMKEVKKSKSQDSLELVAKNASVSKLGVLVQPLHLLMLEKITKSISVKIDTLLARIAAGLSQNPSVADTRDVLVFCYEIIQDVYKSRTASQTHAVTKIDPRIKKFLFQKTVRNNAGQRKAGKFTYKLIQFAMDVLRAILRKYDSLRTAANIDGFVPILGDAVLAGEEDVKIAAYKLLVVLVKVTFPDMKQFSGLYQVCTKEAIKEISNASSTSGDLAQSALKLVSVVLRSRHDDVPVRPAAIDILLTKLKDDLTNPLFRHVTFNFVRAVLDRRVESAAVYDTLDYIGTVMITNDDQDTRDLARRAFFQFLREYPQQRKRWERQLEFIVANFKYEREGGRLQAMEIVYMLLLKSTSALDTPAAAASDPFVQDIVGTCFLPLVMVLANDDSAKCRRVAAAQLTAMLSMAKRDYVNEFLRLFRTWLEAEPREDLGSLKMGVELFGVYFASFASAVDNDGEEAVPVTSLPSSALTNTNIEDVQSVIDRVTTLLSSDKIRRGEIYSKLMTTALETVQTIVTNFPVLALDNERAGDMWQGVEQCLWHGTHSVRMAAMRLVGLHLADVSKNMRLRAPATANGKKAVAVVDTEAEPEAYNGSYGLKLDHTDVARLVRGCLSVISGNRGEDVDPVEAEEAAKMLLHLGQYLLPEPADKEGGDEEDEEEDEEEEEEEKEVEEKDDDDEGEVVFEEEEDEAVESTEAKKPMDRRYVLIRLARIVRRETPPRVSSLVPKAAAMAVLESFCSPLNKRSTSTHAFDSLSSVAVRAILRPLRNLTDNTIAAPMSADPQFAPRYDELKLRATSLMDVLQTRLGNAEYTQALMAVGAASRDRRQQRATKRKIEAVVQPEKHDRDKRKRLDKKKERRKVRGQEHKSARWGIQG